MWRFILFFLDCLKLKASMKNKRWNSYKISLSFANFFLHFHSNMSPLTMFIIILLTFQTISSEETQMTSKQACTTWYGCFRGYCWAGCSGAFGTIFGPEWCYTRDPSTNAYKKCTTSNDCDGCWRCGGICSIWSMKNTFKSRWVFFYSNAFDRIKRQTIFIRSVEKEKNKFI